MSGQRKDRKRTHERESMWRYIHCTQAERHARKQFKPGLREQKDEERRRDANFRLTALHPLTPRHFARCDGFLNYDRTNKFTQADTDDIAKANQALINAPY